MSSIAETEVLTGDEIVARIAKLRPQLRDEQPATDARSYHSEGLHRAIVDTGVYRILLPRKYGGLELSVADFYLAIAEIARGCPSTGWCACLSGSHLMTVASIYGEGVQNAIFAPDGDFRCPARALPHGTATPNGDGDWVVQGRWDYCSGAPYATHFLAAVRLPADEDGRPRMGSAIVPREQWEMQDDWGDQLGMKGSGSHSIVVDAVLPPDYVIPVLMTDVTPGVTTPGFDLHRNPMYIGRTSGFFAGELTAIGIGVVRGALDLYAESMVARKTYWVPKIQRSEDAQYRQWFGHAQMLVDTAEGALLHMCRLYDRYCREHAEGSETFSVGKDTRLMALAINASTLCIEAMDLIIRTAGATSLTAGSPMERMWRDMSTFRTHLSQTMRESIETTAGAAHFDPDATRVQFDAPSGTRTPPAA